MQWIKFLCRCKHKYVVTYRTDRLLILTCTECGTTKSIRLGDKKAWLEKLEAEITKLNNDDKKWTEHVSDAYEWLVRKIDEIKDRNSASHIWLKYGVKNRGDKR